MLKKKNISLTLFNLKDLEIWHYYVTFVSDKMNYIKYILFNHFIFFNIIYFVL